MRLIDADELIKVIQKRWGGVPLLCIKTIDQADIIISDIDVQPTVGLWHYPAKGEYPPKEDKFDDLNCSINVLAFTDEDVFEPSVVAYYIPETNVWVDCVREEPIEAKVIAWQYIVPPKEDACQR